MSTEFELKDLIKDGIEKLQKASDLDATVDAWLLTEEVLGITRAQYFINPQRLVNKDDADKFFKFIDMRCNKIPLQHIIGKQEFMGLSFNVNEDVLIPRQDTELLVESVLNYLKQKIQGKKVKVLYVYRLRMHSDFNKKTCRKCRCDSSRFVPKSIKSCN